MNATQARVITLGDQLSGEDLATANRVLRWHGCPEVPPCTVAQLMNRLTPMELGRFTHIVKEITTALEDEEER